MLGEIPAKEKVFSTSLFDMAREKCQKYIDLFDYESAYFWAEKELALAIDLHNSTRDDKIKPFNSSKFVLVWGSFNASLLWVKSTLRFEIILLENDVFGSKSFLFA